MCRLTSASMGSLIKSHTLRCHFVIRVATFIDTDHPPRLQNTIFFLRQLAFKSNQKKKIDKNNR